jgi:hypothetical protein
VVIELRSDGEEPLDITLTVQVLKSIYACLWLINPWEAMLLRLLVHAKGRI